ncbi:protein kinase [Myxococcus sp. AM011]|uniref:serine/threonine protein kinase n=1 Tax=Myxococcus sp. AM011 TaxID=2745200 RepID=UPI001595702A|nr:protein kinase [Myxococcus sp. AM011]
MGYIELKLEKNKPPVTMTLPQKVIAINGTIFQLGTSTWKGGNGVVFDATRYTPKNVLAGTCAVKFLRQLDAARVDRFRNEVRILDEVGGQKNIAEFFGQGDLEFADKKGHTTPVPWMGMSMGGNNFREVIHKLGVIQGNEFCDVALEMAGAISHLHDAGFIHRDIKPENFVRKAHGKGAMMIDFGIAKRVGENVAGRPLDKFTQITEFVGPANFSSPELLAYARDKTRLVDHRSDMFQFGKLLWFVATGDVSAGIPSKRRDPFGGALHSLVLDLLQDEPDERLDDMGKVVTHLQGLRR